MGAWNGRRMTLGDDGIPSRGRTGSAPIVCAAAGLLAAATIIIAVVIVQPLDVDSPSLVADLTARRDSLLVSSLVDSLGAVALLVFFAGLAARLWQRDAVMLSFALASSGAVAVAVILGQAAIRVVVAGRLVNQDWLSLGSPPGDYRLNRTTLIEFGRWQILSSALEDPTPLATREGRS